MPQSVEVLALLIGTILIITVIVNKEIYLYDIKIPKLNRERRVYILLFGIILFCIGISDYFNSIKKCFARQSSGIFQNFEPYYITSNNDESETFCRDIWFASCQLNQKIVHGGKQSIKITIKKHQNTKENGGTIRIFSLSKNPIDLSFAKSISIWINDKVGNNTIELSLCNGDICLEKSWSTAKSIKNKWTEITWPTSNFQKTDMKNVTAMEIYEYHDGIYYIDDVTWH